MPVYGVLATILQAAPNRLIATASLPLLQVEGAVAEVHRMAAAGFHAVFILTVPPQGRPSYNHDEWEPL